ncbi:MAG: response regulator transcription factor, partial [Actinomycetia bacterium]|nr:response regulator transcription factor [Actinomycetes bacterium]
GSMVPIDEMADRMLEELASGGRPSFGWDSLTPAEERVVALVGEGKSNPEIAESLHITVATVKTHLVHTYQKLDVDSRPALAAAVATRAATPTSR